MPGYKGHLVGGMVIYGLGLYLLQSAHPTYATMAEWLIFTLAGALFPDVDIKSKGQKLLYRSLLMLFGVLLIKGRMHLFILVSILSCVPMIVRHRGLFHKLWFVILFPTCVAISLAIFFPSYHTILLYDTAFFIAGAISHLWLDVGLKRMLRF